MFITRVVKVIIAITITVINALIYLNVMELFARLHMSRGTRGINLSVSRRKRDTCPAFGNLSSWIPRASLMYCGKSIDCFRARVGLRMWGGRMWKRGEDL